MPARFAFTAFLAFIAFVSFPQPRAFALPAGAVSTTTASDIQAQIDSHNASIAQLDAEIAQYQKQLDATTAKKQTLQGTLAQLDLSIKKMTASINLTKNQILTTQLQIQQLNHGIADKQTSIQTDQVGLSQSLRRLSEAEQIPLVVSVLSSDTMAQTWQDVDFTQALQEAVNEDISKLAAEKKSLTDTKTSAQQKQAQLVSQQQTLLAQQGSLTATKNAQADLLAQTKSQESTYQSIIAQKKAQEADFEAALNDLKGKLNFVVNLSDITPAGKGILQWPLDKVRITQYFGNTPFAASGAYNGKGHNGVDFAAPIGTAVHAALSGVVLGTGNTDLVRGCYSFGKWVMVKHANGLNTMYAHFSQIAVTAGQSVSTGDVLGYSGETGYATGPHLHFGVYVSSATQIMTLGAATQSKTPCANATMPITPLSGYLNPLNYLPTQN